MNITTGTRTGTANTSRLFLSWNSMLILLLGLSRLLDVASGLAPQPPHATAHPQPARNNQDNANANSNGNGNLPALQRLGPDTGPTVWTEVAQLAADYDVVNLGQGFPDWAPPTFAIDSLVEAALGSPKHHQYTRPAGHPRLVEQLAERYSRHFGRTVDPYEEVAVTVGASQALYLSLQTLIQPGDEVLLFEPFFDLYVNQVKLAGGVPVFCPLTFREYQSDADTDAPPAGEWLLEKHNIAASITSNCKAVILNSPHNPTGKIFTREEMEYIAEAVQKQAHPDCTVLSDEVYKYIVHAPPTDSEGNIEGDSPLCPGHVHFASLPGMADRTITISSAGKTFSATGWQVGWCIGPKHLLAPIHRILPYVQFCASTIVQDALARTLVKADNDPYEGYDNYYEYLLATYTRKRDLLVDALQSAGFGVPDFHRTPGGGFFILARVGPQLQRRMMAEASKNNDNSNNGAPTKRLDWTLCEWMAKERGILCIPSSPFFSSDDNDNTEERLSDNFVRIAFCKTDETMQAAAVALHALGIDDDEEPETTQPFVEAVEHVQ